MKAKKLGLIHTSATLVPMFQQLSLAKLPDTATFNIVDDSLIKDVIAAGTLTPQVARRVASYVTAAGDAGADLILVTCSSIGQAVEAAAPFVDVPVIRVDRPMAVAAVAAGPRIGVVGTLATTMKPTAELIQRCAAEANRPVELTTRLCDGAFEALMKGDTASHDARVRAALAELMESSDVIVLAQASMARVADTLPAEQRRVPILASPPLALDYVARLLSQGPR
jgi:Asp/Glu/hydantoin racemase